MKYQEKFEEGLEQGVERGRILTLHELGYSVSTIAQKLNQTEENILEILDATDEADTAAFDEEL